MTNNAEIGHLYQLCGLIRICTISYLANDIRKAIIIIMIKLKNKNDNHLYSDIAIGIFFNFKDCRRYFDRTGKKNSFLFLFYFKFIYIYSGNLITEKLSSI